MSDYRAVYIQALEHALSMTVSELKTKIVEIENHILEIKIRKLEYEQTISDLTALPDEKSH